MDTKRIEAIRNTLKPMRVRLLAHEIYLQLETLEDLREFMEHHVFAVWDNLSQLKALQNTISSTSQHWAPSHNSVSNRILHEILLEEESDSDGQEGYFSHFELYRKAMQQAGANAYMIDRFLVLLQEEQDLEQALEKIRIPESITTYLRLNWEINQSGQPHRIAAAYFLGREDVVSELLHRLDKHLLDYHQKELALFRNYLQRHTRINKEEQHRRMNAVLSELCGTDEKKWQEAEAAAKQALEARYVLWDGMLLLAV